MAPRLGRREEVLLRALLAPGGSVTGGERLEEVSGVEVEKGGLK